MSLRSKIRNEFEMMKNEIVEMNDTHVQELTNLYVKLANTDTQYINAFNDIDFHDIYTQLTTEAVWVSSEYDFSQLLDDTKYALEQGYDYKYGELIKQEPGREMTEWIEEDPYMFINEPDDPQQFAENLVELLEDHNWAYKSGKWRVKSSHNFSQNYELLKNSIQERLEAEPKVKIRNIDYPENIDSKYFALSFDIENIGNEKINNTFVKITGSEIKNKETIRVNLAAGEVYSHRKQISTPGNVSSFQITLTPYKE